MSCLDDLNKLKASLGLFGSAAGLDGGGCCLLGDLGLGEFGNASGSDQIQELGLELPESIDFPDLVLGFFN